MSRLSSLLVVAGDGCFLFAKSKVHCYNWRVCLLRCLIVRLPRFGNQLEICWWLVINTTNPSPGVSHGGQGGHTQADEELGPLNRVILPSSCQTRHQVRSRTETPLLMTEHFNVTSIVCSQCVIVCRVRAARVTTSPRGRPSTTAAWGWDPAARSRAHTAPATTAGGDNVEPL